MANRVKVTLYGMTLSISTAESPEYVREIAAEVEDRVAAVMAGAGRVSVNDALALTAINYADAYKKGDKAADRLRSQLAEYLEDAARTRIELDESRREVDRLRRQIAVLEKNAGTQQVL